MKSPCFPERLLDLLPMDLLPIQELDLVLISSSYADRSGIDSELLPMRQLLCDGVCDSLS